MAKRLKIPRWARVDIRMEKACNEDSGIVPSMGTIAKSLSYKDKRDIQSSPGAGKQIKWKFQVGDMVMFTCQLTWKKIRGMIIAINADTVTITAIGGSQTLPCQSVKLIERLDDDEE